MCPFWWNRPCMCWVCVCLNGNGQPSKEIMILKTNKKQRCILVVGTLICFATLLAGLTIVRFSMNILSKGSGDVGTQGQHESWGREGLHLPGQGV